MIARLKLLSIVLLLAGAAFASPHSARAADSPLIPLSIRDFNFADTPGTPMFFATIGIPGVNYPGQATGQYFQFPNGTKNSIVFACPHLDWSGTDSGFDTSTCFNSTGHFSTLLNADDKAMPNAPTGTWTTGLYDLVVVSGQDDVNTYPEYTHVYGYAQFYLDTGAQTVTPTDDTRTRIVSFTPEEATTTSNTVDFDLHVYINSDDVGNVLGIEMQYTNLDQNQVLTEIPGLSNTSILLLTQATTSGDFYFHATRNLPDGNYRVQAKITRTLLGLVKDPFSGVNSTQNHQYIVNQATYVGNLQQNGFRELNAILGSTTATSTAGAATNCNPTSFSITQCLGFLFIPGGAQLDETMNSFRNGIITRVPWGYFYRVVAIMTTSATSTLPTWTNSIVVGAPGNLSTTTLTFDPNDMIAGGGQVLDSLTDLRGHSLRDIMEPFIKLFVALMVIIIIYHDITSQRNHKHS